MSETTLARVVSCDKTNQVWERIQEFFASQTREKINIAQEARIEKNAKAMITTERCQQFN